jgi:hypothetical protein
MDRRTFLKALSAVVGAAAVPASYAKLLPEILPDDVEIALGEITWKGEFIKHTAVKVKDFAGTNSSEIVFPPAPKGRRFLATHVSTPHGLFPIRYSLTISEGVTPMLLTGDLSITED